MEINFRIEHPQNLVNRLFSLHYLRQLNPNEVYKKLPQEIKDKKYFYSFETPEGNNIEMDYNYEKLLFKAPLEDFNKILDLFEDELEEINNRELEELKRLYETKVESESRADISLYDLAKAEIAKSKDTSRLILPK